MATHDSRSGIHSQLQPLEKEGTGEQKVLGNHVARACWQSRQ